MVPNTRMMTHISALANAAFALSQDMQEMEKQEGQQKDAKNVEKQAAPLKQTPKANPAKPVTKSKKDRYHIEDLRALYALADAELLHTLRAVTSSKNYPGSYAYVVDKTDETKKVLEPFLKGEKK